MRVILLGLLLGGCASQTEITAHQAAADNAKCLSYGAKSGRPDYVQCRAQLDAARTQAEATRRASADQPVHIDRPPDPYPGLWRPGQF